jgi:ABC-type uncharacterized transport system auxiliary subunit
MTGRRARRAHRLDAVLIVTLIAGTVLADGCALTHRRAPAIEELALEYSPPELQGTGRVDAAIKVRRFSALSPYDGTTMYFRRGGYRMDSYNYERWVTSPAGQVTDLLYRDLAALHAFRAVFPYLSTEEARFRLEGTVIECVVVQDAGSWRARLVLSVSLVDAGAQQSDRRVLLQREFEATQTLQDGSAEQYAAGMSAAMKSASEAILRAVLAECRSRAS